MSTTAAETRDERQRHNGCKNFNDVLLSGTTTADPIAQCQSHTKKWPTNKQPAQRIVREIVVAATVERCILHSVLAADRGSGRPWQQRLLETAWKV